LVSITEEGTVYNYRGVDEVTRLGEWVCGSRISVRKRGTAWREWVGKKRGSSRERRAVTVPSGTKSPEERPRLKTEKRDRKLLGRGGGGGGPKGETASVPEKRKDHSGIMVGGDTTQRCKEKKTVLTELGPKLRVGGQTINWEWGPVLGVASRRGYLAKNKKAEVLKQAKVKNNKMTRGGGGNRVKET